MLTVQRASPANVDIIAPLFDAYRQFYEQPTDIATATTFLKDRLQNEESAIFIAYWNEVPAGFTQLYPVFSSVSMCRSWILNDLYVDSNYRNRGIGHALLEKAKDHARFTSAKGLLLETADNNITAQNLYEKNGWVRSHHYFYEFEL